MADKANAAAKNRRIRQEALRDYLESRGLVEHVIDLADKIGNETNDLAPEMVARIKISIDSSCHINTMLIRVPSVSRLGVLRQSNVE